jgi:colanic acid biosynthesis glycosyl transferase WcaI
MHILFVTQWYYPEPGTVTKELAETLHAHGHRVTVLTGFPNYPTGKLHPDYPLRLFRRETIGGVSVVRVPLYPDHGKSAIRRILNYVSFSLSCLLIAPWLLLKRADIVHVYNLITLGPPAWLLSRLHRAPLTYEIQDLWPESLAATGMLTKPWILGLVDRFARWVYRRTSAIRVISPGMLDHLIGKGVPRGHLRAIPNWIDTETYRPVPADGALAEKLGLAGRFNVMFAGNIGFAQNLETVIEAGELLGGMPDVQFVLVGDGADLQRLKELAERRNVAKVKFLGRHPSESMPGLYALADVLLVHLRDEPLFRITVPHKIYAYMASGKPILAAMAGDAANEVLHANAGMACPPGDPPALADAVRRLRALSPAERQALGENGRRAACTLYQRDRLVGQIEEMFRQAIEK